MEEMSRAGIVISRNGDIARVQMERMGACSGQHGDCPWNALLENVRREDFVIEARNVVGAKPGDMVAVAMSPNFLVKGAFLVYVVPLLGLLFGYLSGVGTAALFRLAHYRNLLEGLCAGAGFLLSFLVIRKGAKGHGLHYTIIRVLDSDVRWCLANSCGWTRGLRG